MNVKKLLIFMIIGLIALVASGCKTDTPTPAPDAVQVEVTGSVSDGGKLYDKWWKVAKVEEPSGDQPLWATQSTNTRSGADTWRCKECHGWDYLGADGAYGSGSHYTGFTGVFDSRDMSDGDLLAALNGSDNADHDFSAMGEQALGSLVTFLQEGLMDVSPYIDAETKAAVGGDATHGQELFDTICFACHGLDGRMINFGDAEDPEFVGTVASGNPWEFIHKVRFGQPGTSMPEGIDSGWSIQDIVDVMAYAQTLPAELPPPGSATRGGRLYDKWWVEAGVDAPIEDNPVWARQDTNTRSGADTWRCKECHGWDYMGVDGAYGSGSHTTGFPGVFNAQEKSVEDLLAQLTGGIDPDHDFSVMGDDALTDLASFIVAGLIDVSPYINADTKAGVGGDAASGQALYASACSACHGEDGRTINFGDEEDPAYVGNIANDNPWEFIHKARFGQPGTGMTAVSELGWSMQEVVDLLVFAQSLPIEAP